METETEIYFYTPSRSHNRVSGMTSVADGIRFVYLSLCQRID